MSHNYIMCKHNQKIGNGFICSQCYMETSIDKPREVYVHLENTQLYPSVTNEHCTREKNNRTSYTNNSFIHRSIDVCPKTTQENSTYSNSSFGISTRGNRKNTNIHQNNHLERSFVTPDTRYGNRFFEEKPTMTRNNNTRDIGNQQVSQFQQETHRIEKKENPFIPRFTNFL